MSVESESRQSPIRKKGSLIEVFHNNIVYAYERADEYTDSWFGGPLEEQFLNAPPGPRPLHLVAGLAWQVSGSYVSLPPLVYGFNFDGCELRYRKKPEGIEILEMVPEKSRDDFPYSNYPLILPYIPLRIAERRPNTYAEFADRHPNFEVVQPAEVVVAVPPPATIGVSLWGRAGDGECATVVFECDPDDKIVRAYNRCC